MTARAQTSEVPSRRIATKWKLISLAIVGAGLAVFIGANAHLIYVSFASRPECVPHVKAPGKGTAGQEYSAAKSAC